MIKSKSKKISNNEFKRLFGMSRNIYKKIVQILEEAMESKRKRGGATNKLSVEEMFKMTLEYWIENRTYANIAKTRGIAENTCYRNIVWIEETLVKSKVLKLPNKKQIMEDKNVKTIIVDATEIPIERPVKKQKKFYSGKKKMHIVKTQFVINAETGKILSIKTSEGKKHDYRLWKESKIATKKETKILADSGYQGLKKERKNSHIPFKKSPNDLFLKEKNNTTKS